MLTTKMLLLYVNYFYGSEGTSDAQPGAIKCMHMLKTQPKLMDNNSV